MQLIRVQEIQREAEIFDTLCGSLWNETISKTWKHGDTAKGMIGWEDDIGLCGRSRWKGRLRVRYVVIVYDLYYWSLYMPAGENKIDDNNNEDNTFFLKNTVKMFVFDLRLSIGFSN